MTEMPEPLKRRMEERRKDTMFATNFGYDGRELDVGIGCHSLGFDNGWNACWQELAPVVEALQFYADTENYNHDAAPCVDYDGNTDEGEKARQVLEKLGLIAGNIQSK